MFPTIPEDLRALDIPALTALRNEVRSVAMTMLADPNLSAEDFTTVQAGLARRPEMATIIAEKAEAAATLAALSDEPEEEPEVPAEDGEEDGEGEGDGEEVEAAAVAVKTKKVQTTFGQPSKPTQGGPTAPSGRFAPGLLTAADGLIGKDAGASFESWAEIAESLVVRSNAIRSNSNENFTVARMKANYPADRVLTDDVNFNMSKFDHDEMVAALCAPATPYYGLKCMQTTRRPVFNGLPQFEAPRGKVSIMPSPQLSDITTGYGIWSAANEASTNAVKSACQTITCGSPTEYQIYGVYRCLTVRNLLAMTYPELVEAWLNRLQAAQARLAEVNLLNAMGTGATSITTPRLGYNATTTILSTVLNYIAVYQESQRWDISENLIAWIPRWVQSAIKMDMMRRRTTNGGIQQVPSDADVNRYFNDIGVTVNWFIDTPTWATSVAPVSTGGVLSRLPANVQILIHQPGKFALMDRGELNIGVTGNGIYRDNTSNSRNEFTFFFENFEGIVNTDSCPAHILDIDVCYNGAQVDDLGMNCQGGDMKTYQS